MRDAPRADRDIEGDTGREDKEDARAAVHDEGAPKGFETACESDSARGHGGHIAAESEEGNEGAFATGSPVEKT